MIDTERITSEIATYAKGMTKNIILENESVVR